MDAFSSLISDSRKIFLETPRNTCNEYIKKISEFLKLALPKDGMVCMVSVPLYKPSESFDRIIYVEMDWFEMLIPQLQKEGLRLVERSYIDYCDCRHSCDCKSTKIKTGYNIYIC